MAANTFAFSRNRAVSLDYEVVQIVLELDRALISTTNFMALASGPAFASKIQALALRAALTICGITLKLK